MVDDIKDGNFDDEPNGDAEKGAVIGGVGGMVAGAVAGAGAGPAGAVVGAVVGGVVGAAASGAAVAAVDRQKNDVAGASESDPEQTTFGLGMPEAEAVTASEIAELDDSSAKVAIDGGWDRDNDANQVDINPAPGVN